MKTIKNLINIVILGAIFSNSALAYNSRTDDEKCNLPKFRNFSPPEKKKDTPVPEIEAEGEISFRVSGYADPTTIEAVAKDQKLKLTVDDRKSFHWVTAKIPAVLNGKYVRLHLKATAKKGFCVGKDGWLIKVKKAEEAADNEDVATDNNE